MILRARYQEATLHQGHIEKALVSALEHEPNVPSAGNAFLRISRLQIMHTDFQACCGTPVTRKTTIASNLAMSPNVMVRIAGHAAKLV